MWQFLRFQRSTLLWSLALHLVLGVLLLMNAHFTRPKSIPEPQFRVVTAQLVKIPPAPLLQKGATPPDDAARRAAADRERHIEQQRQAAEIARAEAARRDAEAAVAKRLAVERARQVEQQRQAAAAEMTRQRQIAEEAERRAAAERERHIEQQRQAVEIAQAEAAQRQQAEDAERERQIEQQRQAAETARIETERQQKLAEEKEAERLVAVEMQRFTEDLARQQHEQNREADVLAALEAEELAQEVGRYTPAIQDRVRQFWIRPLATARDLVAVVSLRVIPGGEIVPNSVRIVESSGNAAFDQSVLAAVYQASPLPVPAGAAFENFRNFDFTFSPE